MSTAKLLKVTTALSDLANEPGANSSQKIASLNAVKRHVEGLLRKIEGATPKNPVNQVEGS